MLKSLRTFTLALLAFIAGGLITLDAAGVTRISFGTALPTNCVAGNVFVKTSATTGVYWCSTPGSPGTWTAVGAGGTGDVVGPASATADRIAVFDGTTGKLLKDGGQTIAGITAGGGGLVLLEQHTASASASLDFTTFYSSTYDDYVFEIVDVVVGTNNVSFQMQLSSDGGSSWNSTSNYYTGVGFIQNNGAFGSFSSNPGGAFQLAAGVANTSTRPMHGSLHVMSLGSTALDKAIYGLVAFTNQSFVVAGTVSGLLTVSGTAFDAAQFTASSGTFSGTIRCYGLAK